MAVIGRSVLPSVIGSTVGCAAASVHWVQIIDGFVQDEFLARLGCAQDPAPSQDRAECRTERQCEDCE